MKRTLILLALAAACGPGGDVVIGGDYKRVHDPLVTPTDKLDVLFVIDTSTSMMAEQAALIDAAGQQFLAQLEGDLGGPPDVHVAFISTDVSTAPLQVAGCQLGEARDGRFLIGQPEPVPACPIAGQYLIDVDDGLGGRTTNYSGSFIDAFTCAANLGSFGCGFEQPLEAMRKALDGRYPEHAGFLRDDALLLVVFVTDEDDCSAIDVNLFGEPTAGVAHPLGPLTSFRCFEFGVVCDPDDPRTLGGKTGCESREDSAYVTPIAQYADFLRTLKPDPAMVMLAGIYGPVGPVAVVPDPNNAAYPSLQATCSAPETSVEATPPVRLVQLADQFFSSRFVFASLCESAMSERLYKVSRSTTGVMQGRPCLLGNVSPATTGERCRAFDVIGTSERSVPRCDGTTTTGCFEVAASPLCDYTPSGLAASYRGTLAAGHRLVVDCLPAE